MGSANITKRELSVELAKRTGLSQLEAQKAIHETFLIIEDALKNGKKVVISRFGTFMVKERKARIGRNPKTKEAVPIPARKVPYLKFSPQIKNKIK